MGWMGWDGMGFYLFIAARVNLNEQSVPSPRRNECNYECIHNVSFLAAVATKCIESTRIICCVSYPVQGAGAQLLRRAPAYLLRAARGSNCTDQVELPKQIEDVTSLSYSYIIIKLQDAKDSSLETFDYSLRGVNYVCVSYFAEKLITILTFSWKSS